MFQAQKGRYGYLPIFLIFHKPCRWNRHGSHIHGQTYRAHATACCWLEVPMLEPYRVSELSPRALSPGVSVAYIQMP